MAAAAILKKKRCPEMNHITAEVSASADRLERGGRQESEWPTGVACPQKPEKGDVQNRQRVAFPPSPV